MQRLALVRSSGLSLAKGLQRRTLTGRALPCRKLAAVYSWSQRCSASSSSSETTPGTSGSQTDKAVVSTQEQAGGVGQSKRETDKTLALTEAKRLEKFIPVTRRALLRALMEEKGLLSTKEKQLMENVAAALDAKYSKRFYSILEQAKVR